MIAVAADIPSIRRIIADVGRITEEVVRALRLALASAVRWLATRVRREVRDATGAPNRIISGRVFRSGVRQLPNGELSARVWLGTDPIAVAAFGGVRQTRQGVRTSVGTYPGAFVARRGGASQVFERVGAARLPIRIVKREVRDEATAAAARLIDGPEFGARLQSEFARVLRWQTTPA